MNKTLHIYRLTDANGDRDTVVLSDPSDIRHSIGGYDKNGVYQSYSGN